MSGDSPGDGFRLLDRIPVAVFVDREGEILYANGAGARLLGAEDPGALVGTPLPRLVAEAGDGRPSPRHGDGAGDGAGGPVRSLPVAYGGESARLSVVLDPSDGSDRLAHRGREQEGWYRDLVEAVDVVPWELRVSDWTFTYVAPQAERIFGYPRDAWYEPGFWPEHIHPQDREAAVRFCTAQTRQGRDHQFEYRFLHADGHPVWVRDIVSVMREDGDSDHLRGVIVDITERKRFELQLEQQALQDELTGLPNRTLFWDRLGHALARARRERSALSVLFVDLDRFKRINDSLGHAAGDQVLAEVARRLDAAFRDEDTVARFGGDEFAAIVEDVEDEARVEEAARRLLRYLGEPFRVEGETVHLAASVGIALGRPGTDPWLDGGGEDELVRRADRAMFRAKDRPGRTMHVLRPEEDVGEDERLRRERELREGIERDEFRVFYQSLVGLEDGRVTGVEALARWQHPERGIVSPAEFIPLAEESGLIVPLGRKLLREACRTMAGWLENGSASPDLLLSVNLSARQFEDPELTATVRDALASTGLDPSRVCFEVTERLIMRGYDRVEQLRSLGVGIAVDDFGTGYSSLHYLKRLDVEALKIDRSFVSGLGEDYRDDAIVQTVVTLGDTLNLDVIAEGIEVPEQRDALLALGCELGQGFLFDRPMTADEFVRRLGGRAVPG